MAFKSILDEVRDNLDGVLADLSLDVKFAVEPAKPGFGDVSSNVSFLLARTLKQSPQDIAGMLSERYNARTHHHLVAACVAHQSGYLNFHADWARLSGLVLSESHRGGFGSLEIGGGSSVTVEHTSVNPNKALHIGHIRNIVLGDTISRILKKAGHRVHVLNYVDDSGLQVADVIVGFRHLGFSLEPPAGKKFDHYCGDDIYVKTTQRYSEDPALEEVRQSTLRDLEDGASDTARFADKITGRVLRSQLDTCWNLGVYYDCLNFESHIIRSGLWGRVFERLKEMSLIEFEESGKNAGCWVIRGDGSENDKVIVRSNGTATYVAKDIPYAAWKLGLLEDPFSYEEYEGGQPTTTTTAAAAAAATAAATTAVPETLPASAVATTAAATTTAIEAGSHPRTLWRTRLDGEGDGKSRFAAERVITVIDSRQVGLQRIISTLMGRFKSAPDAYVHLGYESVTLSPETARLLGLDTDGRQAQMSGRKGLYISADAVYEKIRERVVHETERRHPDMDGAEVGSIAHAISVGTIRYEMLKQDLDRIIAFDLTKSLSLEGDTASYIQYAGARAARILEKAGRDAILEVDFGLLQERSELDLIQIIGMFDLYVGDAARNLAPKVIARYCHDLAVRFNSFYEKLKVLDLGNRPLEDARLCMVYSFRLTLEKALDLLGIDAPRRL